MGETMPINYARFKRRAFPRVGQTDKQDDLLVAVRESIAALQRAVRYLSLGLDYRKLHRFSQYTPDFAVLSNGDINFFDEKTRRREDEKTRRREDEKTRRREEVGHIGSDPGGPGLLYRIRDRERLSPAGGRLHIAPRRGK